MFRSLQMSDGREFITVSSFDFAFAETARTRIEGCQREERPMATLDDGERQCRAALWHSSARFVDC